MSERQTGRTTLMLESVLWHTWERGADCLVIGPDQAIASELRRMFFSLLRRRGIPFDTTARFDNVQVGHGGEATNVFFRLAIHPYRLGGRHTGWERFYDHTVYERWEECF